MTRFSCRSIALAAGVLIACLPLALLAQVPDSARIVAGADRVISAAVLSPAASPGCAVGISREGRSIYQRAFGMADLENNVPFTPETISESGSVAKQFTAAAIVLLALEGKLDLDDPVRRYIPELPDYGTPPLTIRHLLTHTGGLRDWGAVLGLTGVGRGDRVVTQELAMDVIVRQRGLDFAPGAEFSYTNSGYTLASTIVERVAKQSLPAFTAERFFTPLGMTKTSWRDDYQRVVPGRAQAYTRRGTEPWRIEMPFMNVYGNGGMLTTVGDWLKWNAMLDARSLGGALVDSLEIRGFLAGGRRSAYALGLFVDRYKGHRQIAHGGATAGYVTTLNRYPDLKLSVAVLCNTPSINPTQLTSRIVDEIVPPATPETLPAAVALTAAQLGRYTGLWREEQTHLPMRIELRNDTLRAGNGARLRPLRDGSLQVGQGSGRWTPQDGGAGTPGAATMTLGDNIERYLPERPWNPTPAELEPLVGTWYSEEADATFPLVVEEGRAALLQRPGRRLGLRPVYQDHFTVDGVPGSVVWITRDAAGRPTLHFGTGRMRDMVLVRRAP